jgi:hypothetical protein
MTETERKPCLNCNDSGWVADSSGGWVRCPECNPEPPPPVAVEFVRGAKVRRKDNLPEAA